MTRTISIRPTWVSAVEIYIAALEDGTDTGKTAARAEFRRMAKILDSLADTHDDATEKEPQP